MKLGLTIEPENAEVNAACLQKSGGEHVEPS
jgi:hypothetical protein